MLDVFAVNQAPYTSCKGWMLVWYKPVLCTKRYLVLCWEGSTQLAVGATIILLSCQLCDVTWTHPQRKQLSYLHLSRESVITTKQPRSSLLWHHNTMSCSPWYIIPPIKWQCTYYPFHAFFLLSKLSATRWILNSSMSLTSVIRVVSKSILGAPFTSTTLRLITTVPRFGRMSPPAHKMAHFPRITSSLPSEHSDFRTVMWTGESSQLVLSKWQVSDYLITMADSIFQWLFRLEEK